MGLTILYWTQDVWEMMYLMVLLSIQLQMKLGLQTFVTYKKKGRVCIGLCLQDLGEIRYGWETKANIHIRKDSMQFQCKSFRFCKFCLSYFWTIHLYEGSVIWWTSSICHYFQYSCWWRPNIPWCGSGDCGKTIKSNLNFHETKHPLWFGVD